MSLRKLAFDTATMSSVNMIRLVAQFLVIPVLARLLSPTDYGIVALAMPFMLLALLLVDAGIGMSLVRTPASATDIWSTCFWLSVVLGCIMAAILIALAPLAALIFNEPRLRPMVASLALVVIAQALATVPGAMLQQSRRFRVIARIEIVAVIVGIGTAAIVALQGGAAWALIDQQIAFFSVRLILTWLHAPFRPLATFALHSVKEHLSFGAHMITANIVTFVTRYLDNVLIGKVLGAAAVGAYSMTFQFVRLPMMIVTGPLLAVLYTHLVNIRDDKRALRHIYLLFSRVLAIVLFPVIGMVAVAHAPIFTVLLSSKWSASGTLFLLLSPACALQAVTALGSTIRIALGRTDIQLKAASEFSVMWIASLLMSVWFGLHCVAVAYSVSVVVYSPRALALVLPLVECSALLYLRAVLVPAFAALVGIALYWICNNAVSLGLWGQLGLAAALAGVGVTTSAFIQRQSLRAESESWRQSGIAA